MKKHSVNCFKFNPLWNARLFDSDGGFNVQRRTLLKPKAMSENAENPAVMVERECKKCGKKFNFDKETQIFPICDDCAEHFNYFIFGNGENKEIAIVGKYMVFLSTNDKDFLNHRAVFQFPVGHEKTMKLAMQITIAQLMIRGINSDYENVKAFAEKVISGEITNWKFPINVESVASPDEKESDEIS